LAILQLSGLIGYQVGEALERAFGHAALFGVADDKHLSICSDDRKSLWL
jgi:hypothetical protein